MPQSTKCANPRCDHVRPSGFFESIWASKGIVRDGRWFCSLSCYRASLKRRKGIRGEGESRADGAVERVHKRLGDILVSYGILSDEELCASLAYQRRTGKRIGQVLIDLGLVPRQVILAALSKQKGARWVDVLQLRFDTKALRLLDAARAREFMALPFGFAGEQVVLATPFPHVKPRVAALREAIGKPVLPVFSREEDILVGIDRAYSRFGASQEGGRSVAKSFLDKKVGQVLLAQRLITGDQLKRALALQQGQNLKIGKVLVRLGYISESDLARALAKQSACFWVDLAKCSIPQSALSLISAELASEFEVLPIRWSQGMLWVATDDPVNRQKLMRLEKRLGCRVSPVACARSDLIAKIEECYGVSSGNVGLGG